MSVVPAVPRQIHPTPGMIESFWADLAPTPGRWRRSAFMGLGTVTALVVAWSLQVPSFAAPVAAFFGLLPSNVCTWRKLPPRLALTAAGAILGITVAGVLVQLPWLLLPTFFAGVTLVAYFCPITNAPLELLALLYPTFTAFYVGVFDPPGMPTAVGEISVAYAVGIVTATVFSRLFAPDDTAATLASALAAGFARARARLDQVTARFTAERFEAIRVEAPISSQFARDIQLLERVRQEGRYRDDVAFLCLAVVVVDHALTLTDTMDVLARHDVGRTYRRLLAPQLSVLVASLDDALRAFEEEARGRRPRETTVATQAGARWPDHREAIAAVESQQLALRRTGTLAHVDIAEEANMDAFVRALVSLADSLHLSPAELRERVTTAARPNGVALPRIDPYAARYGVRVGLGTTIAYLIGIVADTADLFNILWHPAFLAVASHGATIRRAGTRFIGTAIGCVVAIIATIAVMPNISELPALAVLLFAVTMPSAYLALGGPRFSLEPQLSGLQFQIVEERFFCRNLDDFVRIKLQLFPVQWPVRSQKRLQHSSWALDRQFFSSAKFDFRGLGGGIRIVVDHVPDARCEGANRFFGADLGHLVLCLLAHVPIAFLDKLEGSGLRCAETLHQGERDQGGGKQITV